MVMYCCCLVGVQGFGIIDFRTSMTRKCLANRKSAWSTGILSANVDDEDFMEDFGEGDVGDDSGVTIEDLNWRVQKLRLEEENKRRFLKAKPRFLPYDDCMRWVQAWGQRWTSEEDWSDWIAMGEKRNSYIPSRPDEYYGRLGEWISWEHFLGVEEKKTEDTEPDEF